MKPQNTLRFNAFKNKGEYNSFINKMNANSTQMGVKDCGNYVKITGKKDIVSGWRVVNNMGMEPYFVDDKNNICSTQQFDQMMRAK
jgi:hypothetical protein